MTRFSKFSAFVLCAAFSAGGVVGCAAEGEEDDPPAFPTSPAVGSDLQRDEIGSAAAPPAPPAPPGPPGVTVPAGPESAVAGPSVPGMTTEEEYEAENGDVAVGANEDEYADADPSALTDFRSALDPYGTWVDDPTYGTVWTPSEDVVGEDFAPYVTAGHWTYDDTDDWAWVSDYDWGWAPFHYGRWAYLGHGWGWVPGRKYAGAWVSWRYGLDGYPYVGWAPLPPAWGWRNGYSFGLGFRPGLPYVFCNTGNVFRSNLGPSLIPGAQVGAVAAHSRVYASPTVGTGRVSAHPVVGPPPKSIGIPSNQIAHAPVNQRGLMQARQFSRPSTATALGARPPMQSRVATYGGEYRSNGLGSSFHSRSTLVASSPRYVGANGAPYRSPYSGGSPAIRAYGSYSAPHYGLTYSTGRFYSPSYGGARAGGAYGGAYGGYHPLGAYHAPSGGTSVSHSEGEGGYHGVSHGGGGYRGGGGFHGGGGHGGGGRR